MTDLNHSYLCGEAKAPLLYETIGNCFDRIAASYRDQEALVVKHQNIRWTYRQYQEQIDKLAAGLLTLGIKPGERVGVWAPNHIKMVDEYPMTVTGKIQKFKMREMMEEALEG